MRGIGGLIVVDFIHLSDPANIEKVLDTLAESLSKDHTPTQISPMSEFGLVEITRKRVRDPLVKLMSECCRTCSGHGRKRTRDSVALEVLRSVERAAAAGAGQTHRRCAPRRKWCAGSTSMARKCDSALARRGAARVSFEAERCLRARGFRCRDRADRGMSDLRQSPGTRSFAHSVRSAAPTSISRVG